MITDAVANIRLDDNGEKDAKQAKTEGESPSKVSDPKQRKAPKFKDFTLDRKQLFTVLTDEEIHKVLPGVPSLSSCETTKPAEEKEAFEVVTPESPFVSAAIKESEKTRTENNALTFKTSGDPRVDFFFQVLERTERDSTWDLLKKSWTEFPLDTLKLVAVLRDIRGGKGIRTQYQDCLYWLYQHHPKTLYENLEELLNFGYWKDCLHLLITILFDGYIHPYMTRDDTGSKRPVPSTNRRERKRKCDLYDFEDTGLYNSKIALHYGKTLAKLSRDEVNELRLRYAREKFENDLKYRTFHLRVAQCFAKQLVKDLTAVKETTTKKPADVSLAAKWAPSIQAHFDRYTLVGSTIAVEILKLAGETDFEWRTKPLPIAVYLARKNYHKNYCVPLRKLLEVPEVPMSAGLWDQVNYKRVASKCMQKNSKSFRLHDEQRFEEFLKKPESTVAGAALKPIEILARAISVDDSTPETERIVIQKQWESLVEDIKSKGSAFLKSAVCVCDVSGSMAGQPMEAAIGLTLITMSVCEKPWDSICVTFSEDPELHHIKPELTLIEKVQSLRNMKWGYNTDIEKVFKLILDMGKKNKLSNDQMPKILLLFTDMEFDEACSNPSATNFEAAKKLFQDAGYDLPTMVFWNLRAKGPGKNSTPVQVNEFGTLLLSGWSAQQLAYIMDQKDISKCSPLLFMLDVISRDRYSKLTVHD